MKEFRGWIPFDVQFRFQHSLKCRYIRIPGVSLVRSRVQGNPICSERLAIAGYAKEIWHIAAPTVAKQGDLVEVNAKANG